MVIRMFPLFPWRRRIRQGECVYCWHEIYKIVSYPWLHTYSRSRYCTPRGSIAYKATPIKEK